MKLDKNKLDLLLCRKQLTIADVAKLAGISTTTLSTSYSKGEGIRPKTVGKICCALDIDVTEIMKEE